MKRVLISVVLIVACRTPPPAQRAVQPRLAALRVRQPPLIDGEISEDAWLRAASSGAFRGLGDGLPTSPHTELRALWDDAALYLTVYCADQDLRRTDSLRLAILGSNRVDLDVSPAGMRAGDLDASDVGVELDGTFDSDEGGDDEEWVVELRVPWARLGLSKAPTQVQVEAWRVDRPLGAQVRTVSWGQVELKPGFGLVKLSAEMPHELGRRAQNE